MKCVPIKPLVDKPQTKNEPKRNQKSFRFDPCFKVSIASAPALSSLFAGGCQSTLAPYGSKPRSAGFSRKKKEINGTTAKAKDATVIETR